MEIEDRVASVGGCTEDGIVYLRFTLIGIERVMPFQGICRTINVVGIKQMIGRLDMQLERINGVTTASGGLQTVVVHEITGQIRRNLIQFMPFTIPQILQMFVHFAFCNPMIVIQLADRIVFNERGAVIRHECEIQMIDIAAQGLIVFVYRLHVFHASGTIVDLLVLPIKRIVHTKYGVELVEAGRHNMQVQYIDGVESMGADFVVHRVINKTALISVDVVIFPPVPSCIGAYRGVELEAVRREDDDRVMHDRVATMDGTQRINKEVLAYRAIVVHRVVHRYGSFIVVVMELMSRDKR